jgi:hypothetical protein
MKLEVHVGRLSAAETVIYLDVSTCAWLSAILRRRIRFRGQPRPELGVDDRAIGGAQCSTCWLSASQGRLHNAVARGCQAAGRASDSSRCDARLRARPRGIRMVRSAEVSAGRRFFKELRLAAAAELAGRV